MAAGWKKIKSDDPKRLAKLAEAGLKVKAEQAKFLKQAKELGKELGEIENVMINEFTKADLEVVKTKLGNARLDAKNVPNIDPDNGGWDAVYAYIVKHKAWEILQKRFGEKACQERWADGVTIPGVKKFYKMSIRFGDSDAD